jgi:hypothetical protein
MNCGFFEKAQKFIISKVDIENRHYKASEILHLSLIATMGTARSKALPWNELSSRLCLAIDAISASTKRWKPQAEPERHWVPRQSRGTSW